MPLLGMDRLNGVVLLVCVCALLVVVSSAVESGRIVGADYNGSFLLPFWTGRAGIQMNYTTGSLGNSTGTGGGNTNGTSRPVSPSPSISSSVPILSYLLVLPAWLLAVATVACFGGACLLILRLRTSVHVIDLEGTLQEMEQQRKYLEETWSYKLRNAALLHYYILMRRACLKVGLRDEPAETPQEYVGRVSLFFNVEKSEAAKFASAVNRSRYGEELSELEAGEASKFMSVFAGVIRRRASEGQ